MDPVEPSEMPAGLTAGRLEGIPFPNLLRTLCRSGKTGVLSVRAAFGSWLYLDRGRVVFAASDNPDRRIGALLLRQGTIRLTDLRAALERQRPDGERLGLLLVEAGCLGEDELIEAVRAQCRDIVADLFAIDGGEYAFREGLLPTEEPITLVETIEDLIQAGLRGVRSFERIRREVGGPSTLYALTEDWRERVAGLALGRGEGQIIDRLERGEESAEYLCSDVLLSNFEIYQALWSLAVLGAIRRVPPGAETVDDDACLRPNEGEGVVEFLLRLCRSAKTGVLYASRGTVERTFHLREGRCIFATSSDPDDGLVTYLLRRGVISLRDREEATQRILTNKRVGTLLFELGVLDEEDLREAVRQQLGEIVWSTVCWDDGDFTFVGGSLPSTEEITLDLDIEALIAEGLRRVTSWSRVRNGCGGLESRLELTPSYLDVLDAMGAGVEEWDITAALREQRTPLEICALVELGDFRVCQVLWCLRVLGAVTVIERVAETIENAVVVRHLEPRPLEVPLEDLDTAAEIPVETVLEVAVPAVGEPDSDDAAEAPTVVMPDIEAECEGSPDAPDEVDEVDEPDAPDESDAPDASASAMESHEDPEDVDDSEPSIWEMERLTRTQRIPREEVEVALRGVPFEVDDSVLTDVDSADGTSIPVEETDGEIDEEAWEPPADLEVAISRFNTAQRLVYRTVRGEVGAGAANFIRACCGDVAEPGPIGDTALQTDGSWDADGLRQAAIASRLAEPWEEYQRLLEGELDRLREIIGQDQTDALIRKIEQVADPASP